MSQIPKSYLKFISEHEWPEINNLPFLFNENEALEPSEDSIQYWQDYILHERQDLQYLIIPIRVFDNLLLCFVDGKEDNLFELDLTDTESKLIDLKITFQEYAKRQQQHQRNLKRQLGYIDTKVFSAENKFLYNRSKAKRSSEQLNKIKRAKNSKIITTRSCVHDRVVALISYKVSKRELEISVQTFLASDHPNYEKWNGLKAALSLLFSEAHSIGIPPDIGFQSKLFNKKLPFEIRQALKELKIEEKSKIRYINNKIEYQVLSSDTLVDLLIRLEKISNTLLKKIEDDENLSKSGICYLLINHIWSSFSIEYIISKVEHSQKLLFGKIQIEENPLEYFDFLNHGKALVLIESFIQKLQFNEKALKTDGHNGNSFEYSFTKDGILFSFNKPVEIIWGLMNQIMSMNETYKLNTFEIIPLVRAVLPFEIEHIKNILFNNTQNPDSDKTLVLLSVSHLKWFVELYNSDINGFFDLLKIAQSKNIEFIVCPYELLELENMINNRLKKVNGIRL